MITNLIVAIDAGGGIGKNDGLPWPHIKEDMNRFMALTKSGNKPAVIMGRKTWESLPERHRPLKDRVNIVVSGTMEHDTTNVVKSVEEAIAYASKNGVDNAWVIGGGQIYRAILESDMRVDSAFITQFNHNDPECDVFFPMEMLHEKFNLVETSGVMEQDNFKFTFKKYSIK